MLGEEEEGEGMRGWRRRMIQSGMREGGEGSDETEERMGLRPWIRREAQIISFSFSLHFAVYVGTFCMDEVPKFSSAARWHRSVV